MDMMLRQQLILLAQEMRKDADQAKNQGNIVLASDLYFYADQIDDRIKYSMDEFLKELEADHMQQQGVF